MSVAIDEERIQLLQDRYRKAAKTREANKAEHDYMLAVVIPGAVRFNAILAQLLFLSRKPVRLRWNPSRDNGQRLRHGARYGTLLGIDHGHLRVLPDGYKRPQVWHPSFWEVVKP